MLLAAVRVAAVDHQRGRQMGRRQGLAGRRDAVGIVVRRLATAQDHVAVLVAVGLHDGDLSVLVHRQEVVAAGRGLDRVGGDLDVAVGAVLEADRRRQPGRQLPVHLAFRGACADRAPGDQVAQVLRRDHVQEFAGGRQAQAVDLDQQLARDAQALVAAEGLVQVGVVDQPFPAHGGAGFLEIHPHHDLQRVAVFLALLHQLAGVFLRRHRIVDRARPDHHQQPVVLPGHDGLDVAPGRRDQLFHGGAADGEETDEVIGRGQHVDGLDAFVVGLARAVAVGVAAAVGPAVGGGGAGLPGGGLLRHGVWS